MQKQRTKNMVYVSLGAVLLALCAWITVPFTVPFTMQTFGVFLLLMIFGMKLGFLSVFVYISLGAIGVPVFSGFNSGIGTLLGPSGGFLMGFLVMTAFCLALDLIFKPDPTLRLVFLYFALWLCYGCGIGWYMIYCSSTASGVGFLYAFSTCVLPYILPDLLKFALALVLSRRLKGVISI